MFVEEIFFSIGLGVRRPLHMIFTCLINLGAILYQRLHLCSRQGHKYAVRGQVLLTSLQSSETAGRQQNGFFSESHVAG